MKTSFLLLILFSLSQIVLGQIDTKQLDAFFNTLETNEKFMGSVALMKDGEIVYTRQSGYLDLENKIKPNINTTYGVGSITKTFTATLILKAIEEGKLALDQTIEGYFPNIKNASKITIEHMLRHRSGIHSYTNDHAYVQYFDSAVSREDFIKRISDYHSDFTPDEKYDYSNSNYILLSFILETIYNDTFDSILNKGIIKPLKLQHTFVSKGINPKENQAKSYEYSGSYNPSSETHYSVSLGAGGIASTATDLLLFEKALFNYKIVSKESVEKMVKMKDRYGLGLISYPYGKLWCYGHGGHIDGFRSNMSFFRESNNGVAIIANGLNYPKNNITLACLAAIYGHPVKIPTFSKTVKVSEKNLKKLVGVYATPEIPLKVRISVKDGKLRSQATGQYGFFLDATSKTTFEYPPAGIVLNFTPSKNEMTIKQGGKDYVLTRE